jgi:putative Holliday junction resolvase
MPGGFLVILPAMRVMALDYGTRAIGVAISDELRLTVRPLTTIRRERQSRARIIARIIALAAEYEVATLVVGLPLRMDGTPGDAAARVQHFIDQLQSHLTIPVVACDERLTSREADEWLRARGADARERRARSDEYAAAIILQDYLAAREREAGLPEPLTRS